MRGIRVEREKPLGAAAVAINREGNALNQEREVREVSALLELRRRHRAEFLEKLGVLRARTSGREEHLIVKVPRVVPFEQTVDARLARKWRPCAYSSKRRRPRVLRKESMQCISNSIVKDEPWRRLSETYLSAIEGPACKLTIYSCLSFRFQTASRENAVEPGAGIME